jgi:hypothetical protein
MNLRMGSQLFEDVEIPLLWGTRAVLEDRKGRLSIVDLSGDTARLEILADKPAPGVRFRPRSDGTVVMQGSTELYVYDPSERLLEGISLRLPTCQVGPGATRVGRNVFAGNVITGFGVGIAVSEDGISLGAPLPPSLAKLRV